MNPSALTNAEYWISLIWYVKLFAAFLVALGVAMEFVGDWVSRPFEKTVELARSLEITRLSAEGESAKAQIADAQARALEAKLALEKFKSPRTLSADDKLRLTDIMKPFAGVPFNFAVQNSPEPINLVIEIGDCLTAAGLQWLPWDSGE